jgi:hypothetical protein
MPKTTEIFTGILLWFLLLFLSGCGGPAKANLKLDQKKYGEAIPLYQSYLKENPDSPEARRNLGLAYFKSGEQDKAAEEFKKVLRAEPGDPGAVLYLGLVYLGWGDIDESLTTLRLYKNWRQPLVEEEVRRQVRSLSDLCPEDEALLYENPQTLMKRTEASIAKAIARQEEADQQAYDLTRGKKTSDGGGDGGDGGGDGCFAYDTQILMADSSRKPIIDLRAGDQVQAYDTETGTVVVREVTDTYRADQNHYYLINGELKITGTHPFFTVQGEWVKAADLKTGDRIVSGEGTVEIVSVERVKHDHRVYNFSVADSHNYFVSAGGEDWYLVHN